MSVISLIAFVCGLYMFLQTVCCCRGRRNLSGEATPRKPVVRSEPGGGGAVVALLTPLEGQGCVVVNR